MLSDHRHLLPRLDANQGCTVQTCSTQQSIYGYRPNLFATVFFLTLFILSGTTYILQTVTLHKRHEPKWLFFSLAMILGCISESIGYIAKLLLHNNPFSDTAFKLSVVVFTFAPAFYSAGIYYNLKHICLTINPRISRLPPKWYTYTFISSDVLSIIFQAIGGAIASASPTFAVLRIGDNIMITGLALQVFTMTLFGLLAADYTFAVYKNPTSSDLSALESRRFKSFLVALSLAYVCILIRCGYRLAELAQGWSYENQILRNEDIFIGLDSVMCAMATLVLNFWHPAWCFPTKEELIESDEEK